MSDTQTLAAPRSDALVPPELAATVISANAYNDASIIYPALGWLRDNLPFAKANVSGYDPFWIVTKYADVLSISRDAKLFINGDNNLILNTQEGDAFLRKSNGGKLRSMNSLAFMDRPEHAKYRNITATSFMPGRVKKLETQIRDTARASVQELIDTGGHCDFARDFAMHYPLRVISTILGVPQEDEPYTLSLTHRLFGGAPESDALADAPPCMDSAARLWQSALDEFRDYFRKVSRLRRNDPRDDLISLISNTKFDGEYLPENYELDYYIAIATAGHDTTASSTTGGMLALMQFPEQFKQLKADPSLTPGFVDEAIRWSVPIKHFMRTAAEDTWVQDQLVQKGDRLFLSYPSANRDASAFDAPDDFDVKRSPNQHLAFGNGSHMCIGQHLAKLDMRVLFEELMPRIASIELAAAPVCSGSIFVSGVSSLPVRFQAA